MARMERVFDIPSLRGPVAKAAVCGRLFAALGGDVLQLGFVEGSDLILRLERVNDFCWTESTDYRNPLLCAVVDGTLRVFGIETDIPGTLPFDPQRTRRASVERITSGVSRLYDFHGGSRVERVERFGENRVVVIGEDLILRGLELRVDGIQEIASIHAKRCQLVFNGFFLGGVTEDSVMFWSDNLEPVGSYPIEKSGKLIPLGMEVFGVANQGEVEVFNVREGKRDSVEGSGEIVRALSEGFQYIHEEFFCPLFLRDSIVYVIDREEMVQRAIDVVPIALIEPILMERGQKSVEDARWLGKVCVDLEKTDIISAFIGKASPQLCLEFIAAITQRLKETPKSQFTLTASVGIMQLCARCISEDVCSSEFTTLLTEYRNLMQIPVGQEQAREEEEEIRIGREDVLKFVLDSLHQNTMSRAAKILKRSFPEYSGFYLFRTLVLQQVYLLVCTNQMGEATKLIEELGEIPWQHFREIWRQTTRNRVRSQLYGMLHKGGYLSSSDEKNYQALQRITTKYPNTSFRSAVQHGKQKGNGGGWRPDIDFGGEFDEKESMIFGEQYQIPDEPAVDSPNFFIGNIALIEAQPTKIMKLLCGEGGQVDRLWILHCEHRIGDMVSLFKAELEKSKGRKLHCLKFVNRFHDQFNSYERETLLDVLCQKGFFAEFEFQDIELLMARICKNKLLFDSKWLEQSSLDFEEFFRRFSHFCAQKTLFVPFEMFVVSHPRAQSIDMSNFEDPLIRFIWDLWVKKDNAAASLSCMQYLANSNSRDLEELWQSLPPSSLAPLASFVWNKDPKRFTPGSQETVALSNRLQENYPLLSALVRGEVPHPVSSTLTPPTTKWRTAIFTSKFDLELHDLVASHFDFDFSKVFTDYYGKTPGQPPFPHFDHPELVNRYAGMTNELPYIFYVKAMLPVSAFHQAIDDGVSQEDMRNVCTQCLTESLPNPEIRLACLTFIELCDLKYGTDRAVDFKICLNLFDKIESPSVGTLVDFFENRSKESGSAIIEQLQAEDIDGFLIGAIVGVRSGLEVDYRAIEYFARRARPAELLVFIDRGSEFGTRFETGRVVDIIKRDMPNVPLKEHLLFHLTKSLPSIDNSTPEEVPPALTVFRALRQTEMPPDMLLLQESMKSKNPLFSILATSIEGNNKVLCAYVTIYTLTDNKMDLDALTSIDKEQLAHKFVEMVFELLKNGKGKEVIEKLRLFSEESTLTRFSEFVEHCLKFSFRKGETVLRTMKMDLEGDELIGEEDGEHFMNIYHEALEYLSRVSANESQVHLFRFLEVIDGTDVSESLEPKVRIMRVLKRFKNFRRALMKCDLLEPIEDFVERITVEHSLEIGSAIAEEFGLPMKKAIKQWVEHQYKTAHSVLEVLEIHRTIEENEKDVSGDFYVSLFISLLPYAQPLALFELLQFPLERMSPEQGESLRGLMMFFECLQEFGYTLQSKTGEFSFDESARLIFPRESFHDLHPIEFEIRTDRCYDTSTYKECLERNTKKVIERLLDNGDIGKARMISVWRGDVSLQDEIELLDGIMSNEPTPEQQALLSQYGDVANKEMLLERLSEVKGHRFEIFAIRFRGKQILQTETNDPRDMLRSTETLKKENWKLVEDIIRVEGIREKEAGSLLSEALIKEPNQFGCDDNFKLFADICGNRSIFGNELLRKVKLSQCDLRTSVQLVLMASQTATDIDECAEYLDKLLVQLSEGKEETLIVGVIEHFPDPTLIPSYFDWIIEQNKVDILLRADLSPRAGQMIVSCARRRVNFNAQDYFDLTLNYLLYREHAELQKEYGEKLLRNSKDGNELQEASRHILLALAYFLHEKCYALSMECLKKLSLISLQLEVEGAKVVGLNENEAKQLMKEKEFPFALTIAVAYDQDTDENWAEILFEQVVIGGNEEFLKAFQYFRPITTVLSDKIVELYLSNQRSDSERERMKRFLQSIGNLVERFRLAGVLGFEDVVNQMRETLPVVCEWCERVFPQR